MFFLRKCVRRVTAKTTVVDRKNQKALVLLCLTSGLLPNVATEFAGDEQLSVPYVVPTVSVLRFFFTPDFSIVTLQVTHCYGPYCFGLQRCFCFAAERKN